MPNGHSGDRCYLSKLSPVKTPLFCHYPLLHATSLALVHIGHVKGNGHWTFPGNYSTQAVRSWRFAIPMCPIPVPSWQNMQMCAIGLRFASFSLPETTLVLHHRICTTSIVAVLVQAKPKTTLHTYRFCKAHCRPNMPTLFPEIFIFCYCHVDLFLYTIGAGRHFSVAPAHALKRRRPRHQAPPLPLSKSK